jgi:hypothetical protein
VVAYRGVLCGVRDAGEKAWEITLSVERKGTQNALVHAICAKGRGDIVKR